MNEPSSASRTPFIIILILLLAITGVQYLFNFNGLGTDAAMDHAQIARNVARGQGMTTNWLRPIHAPASTLFFQTPRYMNRKPSGPDKAKPSSNRKNSIPMPSGTHATLR